MTGKITMVFTKTEDEKNEMACDIDIHEFTKAEVCAAISQLLEHIGISEADWDTWKMHRAVKQLLRDVEELREKGIHLGELIRAAGVADEQE